MHIKQQGCPWHPRNEVNCLQLQPKTWLSHLPWLHQPLSSQLHFHLFTPLSLSLSLFPSLSLSLPPSFPPLSPPPSLPPHTCTHFPYPNKIHEVTLKTWITSDNKHSYKHLHCSSHLMSPWWPMYTFYTSVVIWHCHRQCIPLHICTGHWYAAALSSYMNIGMQWWFYARLRRQMAIPQELPPPYMHTHIGMPRIMYNNVPRSIVILPSSKVENKTVQFSKSKKLSQVN